MHYLPFPPLFFAILIAALVLLTLMIELRVLRYAYMRLGVGSGTALLLLLSSLLGSYINIPLFRFPEQHIMTARVVRYFGMRYALPSTVDWPGTVVAANLGGAVIPAILSLYLLASHHLWLRGFIATACVAAICYHFAQPLQGVGIAMPIFLPPIATAIVACAISWRDAAPLAYISGSLGTLIGADLLNLGKVQGLGAPIASIGGAGTFDGIFLTGILAVLIASLFGGRGQPVRRGSRINA